MFMEETSGKPSVCDWLNPNNTIHNNTGRVLGLGPNPTQTQNPQTCLWRYVTSKSYFLCFFLCGRSFSRRVFELFNCSNHSFQHVFHRFSTIEEFSTKDGDSHVLAKLCQQGQNAAVPILRRGTSA